MKDWLIFVLARWWCYLVHPVIMAVAIIRARAVPDPVKPVSILDKFLWRKIFDHNPLLAVACDKIASKEYVRSVCSELKLARMLWTGCDPDLIPEELFAGNVVIKANHASGWNLNVLDGRVDGTAMRKRTRRWVSGRYGRLKGEWGYENAARCLLVEEMLLEDGQPIRSEYKFHVCGGRTAYVYVERESEQAGVETFALDRDGQAYTVSARGNSQRSDFRPPPSFESMRRIAETLAAPFDFIRCDLYDLDGEIYFSELTAYPASGHGSIGNNRLMDLRNSTWDLRESWFLTVPQEGWRKAYAGALRRFLETGSSG